MCTLLNSHKPKKDVSCLMMTAPYIFVPNLKMHIKKKLKYIHFCLFCSYSLSNNLIIELSKGGK